MCDYVRRAPYKQIYSDALYRRRLARESDAVRAVDDWTACVPKNEVHGHTADGHVQPCSTLDSLHGMFFRRQ